MARRPGNLKSHATFSAVQTPSSINHSETSVGERETTLESTASSRASFGKGYGHGHGHDHTHVCVGPFREYSTCPALSLLWHAEIAVEADMAGYQREIRAQRLVDSLSLGSEDS